MFYLFLCRGFARNAVVFNIINALRTRPEEITSLVAVTRTRLYLFHSAINKVYTSRYVQPQSMIRPRSLYLPLESVKDISYSQESNKLWTKINVYFNVSCLYL